MKKVINCLVLVSTISLSACGGKNLAPTGAMTNFNASNPAQAAPMGAAPYMQPSYNYQAPQQAMAPMAGNVRTANTRPAAPLPPGSIPTPNFSMTRQSSAGPAPVVRTAAPRPGAPAPRVMAPAPKPAGPSTESVGRDLINKTREKFNSLQNFVIQGEAIERDEKGETRIKLKLHFQKPGQVKMELVTHNNSMYNGTKLTYMAGSDQVTGRPGGAMSFMKMTLPMSDSKIKSRRGYRLDQIDTNGITTRLLGNPNLSPKILGKTNINGHEIAVLEFTNVNTFDQRITRELLGIDMQDHFVRIHEMYEGQNLVYSLKLSDVAINTTVTAADFEV